MTWQNLLRPQWRGSRKTARSRRASKRHTGGRPPQWRGSRKTARSAANLTYIFNESPLPQWRGSRKTARSCAGS